MVYFYMYAHPSYVFLHGKMQKKNLHRGGLQQEPSFDEGSFYRYLNLTQYVIT